MDKQTLTRMHLPNKLKAIIIIIDIWVVLSFVSKNIMASARIKENVSIKSLYVNLQIGLANLTTKCFIYLGALKSGITLSLVLKLKTHYRLWFYYIVASCSHWEILKKTDMLNLHYQDETEMMK